MKKVFKIFSLFILIIANIFFVNIPFIYAFDSFNLANPIGIENSILNDLGVNKDELRYDVQTMNVARQKKTPPQVMLTFEPTNPIPGQKVTVTATPSYFINDTKNLYFTWYLKNAKCTDKTLDKDNYKYNSECDLNGDGKVNIEDYKIKAMRIIASNDFDYASNDYSKQTTSNNGYKASGGGDDQKGKATHCYFHDNATGDEYEIDQANCGDSKNGHLFAQPPKDGGSYHATGSGTFGIDDEKFWHTNPGADDTAGTGNNDGANVAGLGEDTFTFNYTQGDKIGVVVEGTSSEPTQYNDASYKTMWAFTKNTCDALKASLTSKYPTSNSSTVTTADSPIANCTTAVTTTTVEDIFGTQVNNFANIRTYTTVETKISCIDPATGLATEIPSGYQADTITRSSTCQQSDMESGGGSVTYNNNTYTCSGAIDGTDSQASQGDITISDLNKCLYENLVTPSEGGGAKQKMNVNISYSPQNPINDSSDGGNGDQLIFSSTVSGAQNPDYLNYTWQVYKGDSIDTENWTPLKKTDIPDATQMTGLGMNSFKFKLNFTGDSVPKFLKVKLSVKDSIAEGETQEGHADTIVSVSSSGERIKIFPITITYPTSTSIDNPTVKFDDSSADNELCLSDPGGTGKKMPSAICPVTKDDLLGIKIDNSGEYSDFLWTIDNVPLTCPGSNFDGCIKDGSGANTNKIYLPILKNVGEQFALGLSATKTNGEKLNLTRVFRVVDPIAKIVPAEKDGETIVCRGKLLGKYSDLQGKVWDDRSETDFNALTGHNINLIPAISGIDFSQIKDANYQWIVDGSVVTRDNVSEYGGYALDLETGSLTLPPKNEGESYIVSFSLPYTQKNSKKQVLNQYWNVGYGDFYEKKLSSQIQIKMVSLSSELAKTDPIQKRILATISSGIPSYVSFLFRMVLSGFALIVIIKVLFYVFPKTKNYYEE